MPNVEQIEKRAQKFKFSNRSRTVFGSLCNGTASSTFYRFSTGVLVLVHSFLLGLIAYWVICGLRTFGYVQTQVLAEKKPWSCNFCMSFWVTGAVVLALHFLRLQTFDPIRSVAGASFAFGFLGLTEQRTTPPFLPPEVKS